MACRLLALSGFAIVGLLALACEATTYTVGDLAGWDTSADLYSWPENKRFYVGDSLLFQYSEYHSVNQVDEDGYRNCNASRAILRSSSGNTSVRLTTPGEKYFICGVLSHCLGGMNLQINVLRKVTRAPPPARPSPPPARPSPPPARPSPPPAWLSPPSTWFSPPSAWFSPPPARLSPPATSSQPQSPGLAYLDQGLLPFGSGSVRGLKKWHLILVLGCCIGALVLVLF